MTPRTETGLRWFVGLSLVAGSLALLAGAIQYGSGYASLVAFATGIGFLRRRIWAWPVAFASAAGFGPIVLVLAMLPTAIVAAGFALFITDVVALLALARSYLGPR